MLTLISFLAVLGVLVFIHELGHFIVAKLSGVGVLKFSLGFGPKILGIKRGETEYLISALPLGGYVKMVGESPGEEVSPVDNEKSFTNKSVLKKAAIVIAGPIMNLVLAFIIFPLIYLIGVQIPAFLEKQPIVGYVTKDEAAFKAGLEKKDTILSINEDSIENWEELNNIILSSPDKTLKLKVERLGEIKELTLVTESSSQTGGGIAGFYPPMLPTIGGLVKGFPAEKAGLKVGDTILAIDEVQIDHWTELQQEIQGARGKGQGAEERQLVIKRGEETFDITLKPLWNDDSKSYIIGISPSQETITKQYGPVKAVIEGIKRMGELTVLTFVIVKKLIMGEVSVKTLGGPLMIAQVAGQAAESGITAILSFMAFLSLQLGILNLLPIPVLDGGLLVFFGVEAIRNKPLSEKTMIITQNVGMGILISLMVFVTYNDLMRMDIIGFLQRLIE